MQQVKKCYIFDYLIYFKTFNFCWSFKLINFIDSVPYNLLLLLIHIQLFILLNLQFLRNLIPILIIYLLQQIINKSRLIVQLFCKSLKLLLNVYMNAQLEEYFSSAVIGYSATFRQLALVLNNMNFAAFTQSSQQIKLLLHNLFRINQKSSRFDLWRQINTRSNRPQTCSNLINLVEVVLNLLKMLATPLKPVFEWIRKLCNGDTLSLLGESRQLLIQLLTQKRHHRMQHSQSILNTHK